MKALVNDTEQQYADLEILLAQGVSGNGGALTREIIRQDTSMHRYLFDPEPGLVGYLSFGRSILGCIKADFSFKTYF